ncbi:MAG: DNA-3-methyladenine glycosylase family protein [Rubrobacteraceae bacterium]
MAERFELHVAGPYSFAASTRFLEGFAPAAYEGSESGHLHMVFVADGGEAAVGVCVRSEGETIVGEIFGEGDAELVRRQVERTLSLDVDGSGFPEVGERDAVVGRLQERYPGLRPVCFYSPYEAAAWAIIGNRIRIVQAARIKAQMATELGDVVEIHGQPEYAFPGPSRLAELEEFPGLFGRKIEYLRGLGRAAIDGKLDAVQLRSMSADEALSELKELAGIGPFSAELILLRGAGEPDLLPENEPRLGRAVAMAYGLDEPPNLEQLRELAEVWRPYRTWVSLHLRAMLEEETGEITGSSKTT